MLFALCQSALAQQPKKIPHIGFLALLDRASPAEQAFLQGLGDLGYTDGQTIHIDYRWAAGKANRLPQLAQELVAAEA